jgi:hypothetical protein
VAFPDARSLPWTDQTAYDAVGDEEFRKRLSQGEPVTEDAASGLYQIVGRGGGGNERE